MLSSTEPPRTISEGPVSVSMRSCPLERKHAQANLEKQKSSPRVNLYFETIDLRPLRKL